jgi:hypothetical protein
MRRIYGLIHNRRSIMTQALRKDFTPVIPERDQKGLQPNPAAGDHHNQVASAFGLVGERYKKALERLAKI